MASISTNWILKLVDQVSSPLKGMDNNVKTSALNINSINTSFQEIKQNLNEAVQPGIAFEDALADVEAITGVTGDALDSLGGKARSAAKHFGVDATLATDNYKTILSKLGPQIAASETALNSMSNNGLTLSKTMNNDVAGAMNTLNTSMLQFQVDTSDPIKAAAEMDRMMNVLAAGAKFGSAEVTEVGRAVEVSGVAMNKAKVSYEEGNAAIQELARGGKNGAEGGVALRNILGKIAGEDVIPKAALAKLKALNVDMAIVSDTTLPFTTRLRELKKAQGDATAFSQVFGVENAAAADILVRSVDAQDDLVKKITGTKVAYEQASIKMNTYKALKERMTATLQDYGITAFNVTKGFLPFVNGVFSGVNAMSKIASVSEGFSILLNSKLGKGLQFITGGFKKAALASFSFAKNVALSGLNALKTSGRFVLTALIGIGSFVASIITATAAQMGFNIALNANPIGLIVLGIAAVIAVIALLITYWDEIKAAIVAFTLFVIQHNPFSFIIDLVDKVFPGFKAKIFEIFDSVKQYAIKLWEQIKGIYNGIKAFLGFGNDKEVVVKGKIDAPDVPDPNKPKPNAADALGLSNNNTNTTSKSTNTSNTGAGKSISMTLNITNNFKVGSGTSQNEIETIADKIIGMINDRLRDSTIALG